MDEAPRVALVGRPNVGKSRLFNGLVGRRLAIVHDQAGVTRDILAAEAPGGFSVLDTGGIGLPESGAPKVITEAVETQVFVAVETADLILFVVDAREGVVPLDEEVAQRLRRAARCPVWLVANKCDHEGVVEEIDVFRRLGFGAPWAVSAEHRLGVDDLRAKLTEHFEQSGKLPAIEPDTVVSEEPALLRIALVGKPNVGKSSLSNRLLGAKRFIVSDVPGTTRDSVHYDLLHTSPEYGPVSFRLVDTAGIRQERKVDSPVEYFSVVRSRRAMELSDVVFLMLDALTGVTKTDKRLAGEILESGRALVVVVNKWDLAMEAFERGEMPDYRDAEDFRRRYRAAAEKELFFLPRSPFLFLSAKTGLRTQDILEEAIRVDRQQRQVLATGLLNRTLRELFEKRAPRRVVGRPFKLFYAVQTGTRPFRFRLFCNQADKLDDSYRRYLENGLLEAFRLEGCPLRFELVGKEKKFAKKS